MKLACELKLTALGEDAAHYLERSADGGLGVGLGGGRVGARDGMGGRGGRPHFGAIGGRGGVEVGGELGADRGTRVFNPCYCPVCPFVSPPFVSPATCRHGKAAACHRSPKGRACAEDGAVLSARGRAAGAAGPTFRLLDT